VRPIDLGREHRMRTPEVILDAPDRTALVTGGTDGIGKEVACGLARCRFRVIIIGRDRDKGARAEQELRQSACNPQVNFLQADLSLMREVYRLADEVTGRWGALHCLIHAAGVVRGRRILTAEGLESNFAINYLSRFALTRRVLPSLRAAGRLGKRARIVLISGAALPGRIYFDDVNLTSNFSTLRVILQSCRANDVFTVEQAQRLEAAGTPPLVTINCIKIGVAKTGIRKEFPRWMKLVVPLLLDPLLAQTTQEVAEPILRLSLAPEFENVTGRLFLKIRKFRSVAPTAGVSGREEGKRLWELSDRLTAEATTAWVMPPRGADR
jgi:NAD(P)-dependent dehydrogenase (short-subunit alcohol dehydrogenase family)